MMIQASRNLEHDLVMNTTINGLVCRIERRPGKVLWIQFIQNSQDKLAVYQGRMSQ